MTVARAALGSGRAESLRLLVGPWSDVRADPSRRAARGRPGASGVYAPSDDGAADRAARRRRARRADAGRGRRAGRGDAYGDQRADLGRHRAPTTSASPAAARALAEPRALQDHFAVAVAPGGGVPLPAGGGA